MISTNMDKVGQKMFNLLFKMKSVIQNKLNDEEIGSMINKIIWNIL